MQKGFFEMMIIVFFFIAVFSVIAITLGIKQDREIKTKEKILFPVRYELEVKEYSVDTVWVYKIN